MSKSMEWMRLLWRCLATNRLWLLWDRPSMCFQYVVLLVLAYRNVIVWLSCFLLTWGCTDSTESTAKSKPKSASKTTKKHWKTETDNWNLYFSEFGPSAHINIYIHIHILGICGHHTIMIIVGSAAFFVKSVLVCGLPVKNMLFDSPDFSLFTDEDVQHRQSHRENQQLNQQSISKNNMWGTENI